MSSKEETEEASVVVCTNCGVAEVDEIKLEECDGCDLDCSDTCREEHREEHDGECKKIAQEIHDVDLFSQPDGSHHGECPICFLPLSLDVKKSAFYPCCSKQICQGCRHAYRRNNGGNRCPFCRAAPPDDAESSRQMWMKRIKANDPAAMREMGTKIYKEGDHDKAFEYWTKAAEVGDVEAHYQLGGSYYRGESVEKDVRKAVYHYEKAAIRGHPGARHNLAAVEGENGNIDRAVKHLIIAAKLGYEESMKDLWRQYSAGNISKEDLDATLRAHKAAIDATKSRQREAAENLWKDRTSGIRPRPYGTVNR